MMDYAKLLLVAINNYNEEDLESKLRLRDLVCIISDNEEQKADPFICELLYIASQKMRVFEYNVQNGFYQKEAMVNTTASELSLLSNEAIRKHYQSKTRPTNILDKSQQEIIDFFQALEIKRMLVSAPTSYGKTFIMREILFLNHNRYNNVLLVFPTVALLRENAISMEDLNKEKEMGYQVIKSIDNEVDISSRNIFVFTPERAMQLMANYPQLKIDFFFYDEMYKIDEDYCYDELDENEVEDESEENTLIGKRNLTRKSISFLDEGRAKTFRICLYLLSKLVEEYYLAGPNLKKKKFAYGMRRYIELNKIAVKEIDFEPTKRIQVDAYGSKIEENWQGICYFNKPENVKLSSKKNDKICDIIEYIESRGYGLTILYCTTPAWANKYATKLSENHQGKVIEDEGFNIFMRHLKRNYNVDNSINGWNFISVLEKGFGIHHGKMPKYIQKEILDMFNRNVFKLLFCTSTIVEGVNTEAKNMVVLNHTKGTSQLTIFDFKNIIGRAGRYYHNFVGRFFLVDKELKKFESAEDASIDFITYREEDISSIDIDNAEKGDLSENNRITKLYRQREQEKYVLPEETFVKNRLIKKEDQERLLQYLLKYNQLFDKFYKYTTYNDILLAFTKYHAIFTILDIFYEAKLLDKSIIGRYKAISDTYCQEGFRGLLKYEIGLTKIPNKFGQIKSIDSAYMAAFKTQKDILENKIPKMLALFESIFICACKMKNKSIDGFSLSKVIRFYETGVKSYFGEQLIEFGYPVDAIRRIEKRYPYLIRFERNETKNYIRFNFQGICSVLDEYERVLLKKAIQSIF